MSTSGRKVLGTSIIKTKGPITKDTSLLERIDALLKIIPGIKRAIIEKDKTLRKRVRVVLGLTKMGINLEKCKDTYKANLKLSCRYEIDSNIPSLVDDIQDRIAYYMSCLIIEGYDMNFFMKFYTPEERGIIEIKKDDIRTQ